MFRKHFAPLAVALTALLPPIAPAMANINTVTPSPASADVAMNQASAVTIRWIVTRTAPSAGPVVSTGGTLIVAGTPIAINRTLSRPTVAGETVVLVETLVVPRAAIVRAIKSGGPLTMVYSRIFTEGATTATNTVILTVNTGGAASFGISRLTLKFLDDDSRATVRATDTRLRAVAQIRFNGSGLLQAAWQIATPTSTPGEEIFRTLRLERRQLVGNGEVELISPPLPTNLQGQYFVALAIQDPGLGFDTPRLIYTILPPGAPLAPPVPQSIAVSAPAPAGSLAGAGRIDWSAAPGAAVYRIVLMETVADPLSPPESDLRHGGALAVGDAELVPGPVAAGFYMPATVTEAPLPRITAGRLTGGRRYLLQVQALDPSGAVVAESRPQEVYWP
jgi:hypothetical protein